MWSPVRRVGLIHIPPKNQVFMFGLIRVQEWFNILIKFRNYFYYNKNRESQHLKTLKLTLIKLVITRYLKHLLIHLNGLTITCK